MSSQLIHKSRFGELEQDQWWPQLNHTEQVWVRKETQALGEELIRLGQSRLVIGRCLKRIHEVLEPKRLFGRFLEDHFVFRRVTAYRYMKHFKDQESITVNRPAVLNVAMAHGLDRITPGMLRNLPENDDHQEILQHLLKVHRKPKKRTETVITVTADARVLLREVENFAESRFSRMTDRQRREKTLELCGILLGRAGYTKAMTIDPVEASRKVPAVRLRTLTA